MTSAATDTHAKHDANAGPHARPGLASRLALALGDIKLAHSVFALPFAVLCAFLVAPRVHAHAGAGRIDWAPFLGMLALVIVCMVFARTWAMLVNRVADARLDAANERTKRRAFASGALTQRDGAIMLALSGAGFITCCSVFGFVFGNWWPTLLSVPVLVWIAFYSFTKRFTWLCHVFLGGALAASPIAAAIAVAGLDAFARVGHGAGADGLPAVILNAAPSGVAIFWITGMVLCWVAGFDVIYALQDLDYDRGAGLRSVPARFGWRGAAWISRLLHAGAIACLVMAGVAEPSFASLWWVGVGIVAGALVLEHVVLARRGKAGIPMAFFTLNGIVSVALGLAGVLDVLV